MGRVRPVTIGQIGLGSWGPNLLRNFAALPGCRVLRVADLNPGTAGLRELPGGARFTTDPGEILGDPAIDAVVIATPAETHHPLGREALRAGKHVFVEKPLALTSREGAALAGLARRAGRRLMVGHLLLYHPAIETLGREIRRGRIGRLFYLGIRRRAFGRLQERCSVLWDLGPHDISLALMLTGARPRRVSSVGRAFHQPDHPEIVFTAIDFAGGALAHIEESWMAPAKERQILAVGERGMLLFDELAPDGVALRFTGKTIRVRKEAGSRTFEYRDEGEVPVAVPAGQPLAAECREFLECIREGREPRTGGENGVAVLRVLEAAEASQRAGGAATPIGGGRRA